MKLLILTAGSRGDVQPYVALGRGLRDHGHHVTVATAAMFESFVASNGLHFASLDDSILRLKDTAQGKAALEGKGNKLALMRQAMPMMRRMLDDAWSAAKTGFDAVIYHLKPLSGAHIAEKLGIPGIVAMPQPITPTGEFPLPIMFSQDRGAWLNRATYNILSLTAAAYAGMIARWRAETLGLPKNGMMITGMKRPDRSLAPAMYGVSPSVVPLPADYPKTAQIVGYWFLHDQRTWQPPADLLRFLEAGDTPIYIGFGSMTGTTPEARAKLVMEALAQSGQRAILATGWGGLKVAHIPENVYVLEEAPHEWLFPQVKAVVHHGGAGTTAAGLRAGKPTLIIPFFGDQGFWGKRMQMLGVGVAPIPQKRLSVDNLAEALHQLATDRNIAQKAAQLGAQICTEDGIANADQFIRSLA